VTAESVAADVKRELEGLRKTTTDVGLLQRNIVSYIDKVDTLTSKVNRLTDDPPSTELVTDMARALENVRRAASGIQLLVEEKRTLPRHEYISSLDELGGHWAEKLDEAIRYFGMVAGDNPAALRESARRQMITIRIDEAS
jgi:hypothetical protein